MAEIARLYPKIDFSKVRFNRIPKNGFLIGFDSNNDNKLSKMDRSGKITVIESFEGNGDGSNFRFFTQPEAPTEERNGKLYHGNIWYDTVNVISYIYTKITNDDYVWLSLHPTSEDSPTFQNMSREQILNITSPIEGEMIYNNTDKTYVFWNSERWKKIETTDL
jgi:hypothetical protein